MNLLTAEHLKKSYTERLLFDDVAFSIGEGDKIGLIGINGTGKSTLLKIMAGLEETDEGTVTKANHAVIAYLPQHPVFDPEMTALDCVLAGHRELSGPESGQAEKRDHQDEAALVTKAKTMLTKLGVSNFDQKSGELSGGQRKRLALVSVLLKEADILLLDEPTNHLDNEMVFLRQCVQSDRRGRQGKALFLRHELCRLSGIKGAAGRNGTGNGAKAPEYPSDRACMGTARRAGAFDKAESASGTL